MGRIIPYIMENKIQIPNHQIYNNYIGKKTIQKYSSYPSVSSRFHPFHASLGVQFPLIFMTIGP